MASFAPDESRSLTFSMTHNLGDIVRSRRQVRGIGLRDMARMMGVSVTYLANIERAHLSAGRR